MYHAGRFSHTSSLVWSSQNEVGSGALDLSASSLYAAAAAALGEVLDASVELADRDGAADGKAGGGEVARLGGAAWRRREERRAAAAAAAVGVPRVEALETARGEAATTLVCNRARGVRGAGILYIRSAVQRM